MSGRRLSGEQQAWIATELACFATPAEVVAAFAARWPEARAPSVQAVEHYDPTKLAGRRLAPKLRQLFHEKRAHYSANLTAIPIANAIYRLRRLQEIETEAGQGRARNLPLLLQALQSAGGEIERDHRIKMAGAVTLETLVHVVEQVFAGFAVELARARKAVLRAAKTKDPAQRAEAVAVALDAIAPAIEAHQESIDIPGVSLTR